jgi:hypothetical protein
MEEILSGIAEERHEIAPTFGPQRPGMSRTPRSLWLWEAFVSGDGKPEPNVESNPHVADAACAVEAFVEVFLGENRDIQLMWPEKERVISLYGDALLSTRLVRPSANEWWRGSCAVVAPRRGGGLLHPRSSPPLAASEVEHPSGQERV